MKGCFHAWEILIQPRSVGRFGVSQRHSQKRWRLQPQLALTTNARHRMFQLKDDYSCDSYFYLISYCLKQFVSHFVYYNTCDVCHGAGSDAFCRRLIRLRPVNFAYYFSRRLSFCAVIHLVSHLSFATHTHKISHSPSHNKVISQFEKALPYHIFARLILPLKCEQSSVTRKAVNCHFALLILLGTNANAVD